MLMDGRDAQAVLTARLMALYMEEASGGRIVTLSECGIEAVKDLLARGYSLQDMCKVVDRAAATWTDAGFCKNFSLAYVLKPEGFGRRLSQWEPWMSKGNPRFDAETETWDLQ